MQVLFRPMRLYMWTWYRVANDEQFPSWIIGEMARILD